MEDRTELSQWIEKLANDGTWESEGGFTLEQAKAWEKLGAFQLPFPQGWILKLVQSAVLAACEGLIVRQTGSETVFRFAGQTRWTPRLVTEALFSSGKTFDEGLTPLAVAIRHLAHRADRLLALHYPDGTTQVWDGEQLRSEVSPQETDSFQLTVFSATKEGARWSFLPSVASDGLFKSTDLLCRRAYACPIPIVLNGTYINGFSQDPHAGATPSTSPFALLPLKPDTQLLSFRFLRDTEWQRSSQEMYLELKGDVSELTGEPVEAGALAFLSASISEHHGRQRFHPQPNFLKWVKDGVIVKTLKFKPTGSVGVTIIACANDLRTDLSGLELATDSHYLQRKEHVHGRVRVRLRKLLADKPPAALRLNMRGKPHKLAMLASFGAGIVQPLFFGITGLAAAQYLSDRLWVRRREWQLAEDLDTLCMQF